MADVGRSLLHAELAIEPRYLLEGVVKKMSTISSGTSQASLSFLRPDGELEIVVRQRDRSRIPWPSGTSSEGQAARLIDWWKPEKAPARASEEHGAL